MSGQNNTIGGGTAADRNIVSGNNWFGIVISLPAATGNLVQGNYIGTDSSGTRALGDQESGVVILNASGSRIGAAGEGNTIAFNKLAGVTVYEIRNAATGNAIYANGGLGIDLGDDGPTPNDPLDADTGPNQLQNTPVLESVETDSTKSTIRGVLSSAPNTAFRVELFASPPNGQGQIFLGSVTVTTDGDGNGAILFTTSAPFPVGWTVTAAATDPAGNTSEFAAAVSAIQVPDDVTFRVQLGGCFYNRRTGRTVQVVTITNTSAMTINAPISLVLDGLVPDVALSNGSGFTQHGAVIGSPYINISATDLAPGQSLTVTLEFYNPTGRVIRYTPRVLAGPGAR